MTDSPMLGALGAFLARYDAALERGRDRLAASDRAELRGELARLRAAFPLDELVAGELLDPEAEELRAELADFLLEEEIPGPRPAPPSRPGPAAGLARALLLSEVLAPALGGLAAGAAGPRPVRVGPGAGLGAVLVRGLLGAVLLAVCGLVGPGPDAAGARSWLMDRAPMVRSVPAVHRPAPATPRASEVAVAVPPRLAPELRYRDSLCYRDASADLEPAPAEPCYPVELLLGGARKVVCAGSAAGDACADGAP